MPPNILTCIWEENLSNKWYGSSISFNVKDNATLQYKGREWSAIEIEITWKDNSMNLKMSKKLAICITSQLNIKDIVYGIQWNNTTDKFGGLKF